MTTLNYAAEELLLSEHLDWLAYAGGQISRAAMFRNAMAAYRNRAEPLSGTTWFHLAGYVDRLIYAGMLFGLHHSTNQTIHEFVRNFSLSNVSELLSVQLSAVHSLESVWPGFWIILKNNGIPLPSEPTLETLYQLRTIINTESPEEFILRFREFLTHIRPIKSHQTLDKGLLLAYCSWRQSVKRKASVTPAALSPKRPRTLSVADARDRLSTLSSSPQSIQFLLCTDDKEGSSAGSAVDNSYPPEVSMPNAESGSEDHDSDTKDFEISSAASDADSEQELSTLVDVDLGLSGTAIDNAELLSTPDAISDVRAITAEDYTSLSGDTCRGGISDSEEEGRQSFLRNGDASSHNDHAGDKLSQGPYARAYEAVGEQTTTLHKAKSDASRYWRNADAAQIAVETTINNIRMSRGTNHTPSLLILRTVAIMEQQTIEKAVAAIELEEQGRILNSTPYLAGMVQVSLRGVRTTKLKAENSLKTLERDMKLIQDAEQEYRTWQKRAQDAQGEADRLDKAFGEFADWVKSRRP